MNSNLLLQGADSVGVNLDGSTMGRFQQFMTELLRWNRAINLTSITSPDEIVLKHFVDSLSIVPLLNPGERLLDVGSGAGLPGLVVALVRSDLTITSLDAVDKKVRFQRHLCRLLDLTQVEVVHGRIEQFSAQHEEGYDVVTSRAFRDLDRFATLTKGAVRRGGRLVAMMAGTAADVATRVDNVSRRVGMEHLETRSYNLLNGLGARNLVVLQRNML